ncbi:MAG TPA: right-handed parallel beta-helix repeat-containing protein [Ignavibacteriaceae bacterium]
MKKVLLTFILISTISFAQYTTPGSGVNWNLDSLVIHSGGVVTGTHPNYTIAQKVFVSANDLVWITPGSILQFTAATAGFEVNGIFKSEGTADSIITFTSPVQDSTGSYEGIRFNANPMSSSSIINYTYIEYADYGMRCIDANPVLTHSHIYKCGRGAQLSGSDSEISFNKIERCYEYGILINLDSNPLIEGNEIAFNNTQATSAKNQVSTGLQGNNSPVIRNNTIYGGESIPTGAISLWVSGGSNFSNSVIEGNIIYNNSFGITLLSSSNGIINAVIKNNIIYNNNINPNALVSGSGININGSSFNQPVITGNELYGNWWGITIQNGTTVQAGPQPNIGNLENGTTEDDGWNIIYNNIQGTDVFDLYNNCTNDIYAHNNDWRVYDSLSIEQHIFHKADNSIHGLVKFIPFSNLIPVEITPLSATVYGNDVVIVWVTITEENNAGFEIERTRINTGTEDWIKLGFVIGNGTTTTIHSYSFNDNNLSNGMYVYRIKQIDFDGSLSNSSTIEIEINLPEQFSLEQNYPNPFNPATKIKYTIPEVNSHLPGGARGGLVTLKIYDILGNEIAILVNEEKPAGEYEVEFNSVGLTSGVYFYQLKTNNFISTKKMILLR